MYYSAAATKSTVFDEVFHMNRYFNLTQFWHIERKVVKVDSVWK